MSDPGAGGGAAPHDDTSLMIPPHLMFYFPLEETVEISEHGMPNLPTLSRPAPRRLQVQTSPFTFDGHQVRSHPDPTKEFRRETCHNAFRML